MHRTLTAVLLATLLLSAAPAQPGAPPAGDSLGQSPAFIGNISGQSQQSALQLFPPSWPNETTFEFGIYSLSAAGPQRTATAYYRILKEETMGKKAYRFKYVGRNPQVQEATECWADPASFAPLRSTRKVIYRAGTYYQDVAYGNGGVTVRERLEGQAAARENTYPAAGALYDYEELIWLCALLNMQPGQVSRCDLFYTIGQPPGTVTLLISCGGQETLAIGGHKYPARAYSFTVGSTPYKYWMVMQAGQPVPARIDMADTRFENAKLSPKKVTPFPKYSAAPPLAQAAPVSPQQPIAPPVQPPQQPPPAPPPSNPTEPYLPPPPSSPY